VYCVYEVVRRVRCETISILIAVCLLWACYRVCSRPGQQRATSAVVTVVRTSSTKYPGDRPPTDDGD
jgi:hypothetical protein